MDDLKNLAPYIVLLDENCNELLSILAYTMSANKLDLVKEVGDKMRKNATEALETTNIDGNTMKKEFRSIMKDFITSGYFYTKSDIKRASYWIREAYKKYEVFWNRVFSDEKKSGVS